MCRSVIRCLFVLVLILGLAASGDECADARSRGRPQIVSPVAVRIEVARPVFQADEPLEGEVILTNLSPENVPAVFELRIFHDDRLMSSFTTSLSGVPQGTTPFAFKNFGIPALTKGSNAVGTWRIVIYQRGLAPEQGAEVAFQVVSKPAADPAKRSKPKQKKKSKAP